MITFTVALAACSLLLTLSSGVSADCPGVTGIPAQCKCESSGSGDTEVTCVNINGNKPLTEFPLNLPINVIHLELYGHNISTIESVPYPHLTTLRLANNSIKVIRPEAFKGLKKLRHLLLSTNRLESVPRDLFADLVSLQFLKLDGNRISKLMEGTFNGGILKHLLIIDLANNSIAEIDDNMFSNMHLAELNISQNSLSTIPKVNCPSMESLVLDHNKIERILDDDMKMYPNLTALSLHHNMVNNISSKAFRFNPRLEQLNLEHNQILEIRTGTFVNQTAVRSIRLSWNKLEFLNREAIPWNGKLYDLRLYGNPWRCVCDMRWLYNASKASPVFMSNYGSTYYRCASPWKLKGKQIYQVMASDLQCDAEVGHVRLVMIIGLVIAVVLVLLIGWFACIMRRNRLRVRRYRHAASTVYKNVTEPNFVVENSDVAFHDEDFKQLVYSDRKK